jgi:hypothetical protein
MMNVMLRLYLTPIAQPARGSSPSCRLLWSKVGCCCLQLPADILGVNALRHGSGSGTSGQAVAIERCFRHCNHLLKPVSSQRYSFDNHDLCCKWSVAYACAQLSVSANACLELGTVHFEGFRTRIAVDPAMISIST